MRFCFTLFTGFYQTYCKDVISCLLSSVISNSLGIDRLKEDFEMICNDDRERKRQKGSLLEKKRDKWDWNSLSVKSTLL